ncbi:MAG: preprotein translocase subunit SecG [Sphingobacteriales bacterium]|nr:MAG: preprotein translocase subunit SecG [Sphingobacteriales bacterium]
MTILFLILIILASVILGFFVLVQNPKGGGLAGSVGGLSNQFMGVKQTTDVLEKGTWVFAGIIALLCLASTFFINNRHTDDRFNGVGTGPAPRTQQAPAQTPQAPVQPR